MKSRKKRSSSKNTQPSSASTPASSSTDAFTSISSRITKQLKILDSLQSVGSVSINNLIVDARNSLLGIKFTSPTIQNADKKTIDEFINFVHIKIADNEESPINQDHNKHYNKALKYAVMNRFEEAINEFTVGFEEFSKSKFKKSKNIKTDYYINFAKCFMYLNKLDQARENINLALALSPTLGEIFSILLEFHLKSANTIEAKKVFDERSNFQLTNKQLAKAYDLILEYATEGVRLFTIEDKSTPDNPKSILKELSEFAISHGFKDAETHYDACLGEHYFINGEFDKAISLSIKLSKSKDLNVRVAGLYNTGLAYQKKDVIKLAMSFFKEVLKIYRENNNNPRIIIHVRMAAYVLAKIYDGEIGEQYWNPSEAVSYLTLAADLGHTESCHDLGYKYETGEDVDADLDMAAKYYRKAADAGYINSALNLGILKFKSSNSQERVECISLFETILQSDDIEQKAIAAKYLGTLYLQICSSSSFKAHTISINISSLALFYLQLAHRHGAIGASFNLGVMHFNGFGTPINLLEARKYFLIALEQGIEDAIEKIEAVYITLINEEKDSPVRAKYMSELIDFGKVHNLNIDPANLKKINESSNKKNKEIYQHIHHHAESQEIGEIERVNKLLDTNLQDLNSNNLCMLIHKLGWLVDRNFGSKEFINFYKNNYSKIGSIIVKLCMYLPDHARIETRHLPYLIIGLSKLHLNSNFIFYQTAIENLFTRCASEIDKIQTSLLINIIFSVTHLDSDLNIFQNVNLLINKLLERKADLNKGILIDLLNSIVVLNSKLSPELLETHLKKLVGLCLKIHNDQIDHIDANKLYISFKYLSQKKEWNNFFKPGVLYELKKKCEISDDSNICKSKLQRNVIKSLTQFIHPRNIFEEKMITVYPVDALIRLSDSTAVILQVDGPTHFLHGSFDGALKGSPRTLFRDEYLKAYYPLIKVNYREWNELKTPNARSTFLKSLISSVDSKPNLMKKTFNRNGLFVSTNIASQPDKDLPSGALSGVYYTESPRVSK